MPVAAAKLTASMWSMFGPQVISTATPRLKALRQKPRDVEVVVSASGIRVVAQGDASEVLETEPMHRVSYAAVDASDKKKFAYITHYSRLGLVYCHCFTAKPRVIQDIPHAIMRHVSGMARDPVTEADRHEKTTGATLGIYETWMLGTVAVSCAEGGVYSGKEQVEEAVMALQTETGERKLRKDDAERVVLVISSEAIRTVECVSRNVVSSVSITNVTYITEVVGKKTALFAVVFKDDALGRKQCQIYLCEDDGEPNAICESVKDAYRVNREDERARKGNPFMPWAAGEEPVDGLLGECQIPRRDLTARRPLGAGQFGEVFLAEHAGAKRAVKMLRGGAAATDKRAFLGEARIMLGLNHPNVLQLTGVCAAQRPWLVVLEFCPYGDLLDVLQTLREKGAKLALIEQLRLGVGIASGLAYVAQQGLVHMDMAARNCLLHEGNVVKVADFGHARRFDPGKRYWVQRRPMKLSIRWLCVEAMGPPPKKFSEYSDVWSYGIVLMEIFTYGRKPYPDLRVREVQRAVMRGRRMKIPSGCPSAVFDTISACWAAMPEHRPNFEVLRAQLEEHTVVAGGGGEPRDVGKLVVSLGAEASKRFRAEEEEAAAAAETEATVSDRGPRPMSMHLPEVDGLSKGYDYVRQ